MSESPAPKNGFNDTEVVAGITPASSTGNVEPDTPTRLQTEPFRRFKRRMERARGLIEDQDFGRSVDPEDDLRVQLMLLQEENARLKAERHKPADPGSVIDEMRTLADSGAMDELLDEAWSVLGECLALREGLDRACSEIQAAMTSVRDRLSTLGVRIESLPDHAGARDGNQASLSA